MSDAAPVALRRLELEQFRSHIELVVDVPEAGLRIIGPNGSGKTTILEAVQLLSTTRPRHGATDSDLINHESGFDLGLPGFARAVGLFRRGDTNARLEAFIQRLPRGSTAKKTLKIGDRARRATDVVGLIPTVSFAPDDLNLVLGSPSIRRRFLDVLLSQIDRQYLQCLSKYAKIVTQRNGLLRRNESDGGVQFEEFAFWDEQLIALGAYIVGARVRAVHSLARMAAARFSHLSPIAGELDVTYSATLDAPEQWWTTIAQETSDVFDAAQRVGVMFERRLAESRAAELARGATLIGPHRDDLRIALRGHDIARFGSRGQQRVAVVAIKLGEIDLIAHQSELRPIFLVDDVLSELDQDRRQALLTEVTRAGSQLIVTSTDRELLERPELGGAGWLELTDIHGVAGARRKSRD